MSPYPYATAPDIVRAHQKDAYFTGHLTNTLSDLHRRLFGARSTHAHGPELASLASLLYFALTTLPGNRTLGEEYCDLVQVEASRKLPSLRRRALYLLSSIIVPYAARRLSPSLRANLRPHWDTLSTYFAPSHIQAVTLALFYFNGTYYELSKRLLSLRYVFTRRVPDSPARAGYEVLGVLLVIQLVIRAYMRVGDREPSPHVDVSLDHANSYSSNTQVLLSDGARPQSSRVDLALTTHTPVTPGPRFDLRASSSTMAYIKGSQQRKCTLCLEEHKDPAATQCGHVFCWDCIGDWVREKPECPLCRRDTMMQHILPLRVM